MNICALLLSGGNDIGAIPQRDLTENCLLSWAEKNRKPVLGICRGMQMMGVYAGGKLVEVDGHVRTRHQLEMSDNNINIFSESVNSYHNQVLQECPDGFDILAKSEDGNLEAMKHKELPWEAWMWHPEREENFTKKALQKAYDKMLELYPDRTTSFESFSTYMNYIPNIKANKGRWSKYLDDREKIIKILLEIFGILLIKIMKKYWVVQQSTDYT